MLRLYRLRVVPDEDNDISGNGEDTYPPSLRSLVSEAEVDAWLVNRKVTRNAPNIVARDLVTAVDSASNIEICYSDRYVNICFLDRLSWKQHHIALP